MAACCPRERGCPHPRAVGSLTRNSHHRELGFPLVPHPFHLQVTVTLSPHLLAPLCSWFFTSFCSPEQSLGNRKPEAALLHGSIRWGHWSSLNLALMLLAASLTGPGSQAHLPFQHWHSPNTSLAWQQSKTGGSSFPEAWGMLVSLGPHLLTWLQLR